MLAPAGHPQLAAPDEAGIACQVAGEPPSSPTRWWCGCLSRARVSGAEEVKANGEEIEKKKADRAEGAGVPAADDAAPSALEGPATTLSTSLLTDEPA